MKSAKLRHSLLILIILLPGLFTATPTRADEDGRYRAMLLQEGGSSAGGGSLAPRVFLIDSRDGHMWIWERNTPLIGPDKQSFGTVLTYQGKLVPGKQVGEIIYQERNNP
ncbi:MAG: hypothetical protein ACRERU_20375 [Methylococcales bacterium]